MIKKKKWPSMYCDFILISAIKQCHLRYDRDSFGNTAASHSSTEGSSPIAAPRAELVRFLHKRVHLH